MALAATLVRNDAFAIQLRLSAEQQRAQRILVTGFTVGIGGLVIAKLDQEREYVWLGVAGTGFALAAYGAGELRAVSFQRNANLDNLAKVVEFFVQRRRAQQKMLLGFGTAAVSHFVGSHLFPQQESLRLFVMFAGVAVGFHALEEIIDLSVLKPGKQNEVDERVFRAQDKQFRKERLQLDEQERIQFDEQEAVLDAREKKTEELKSKVELLPDPHEN